jgi:tetratricopeptide (TPR) repeat protein
MAEHFPGKNWLRSIKARQACIPLLFSGLMLLDGCGWVVQASQNMHLRGYDNDISNATQAIVKAGDSVERAKAYSSRGSAYAEKARYSRGFKLISAAEDVRLFDLAMKDHDVAITLNPGSAEVYYNRGKAYWDRGTAEMTEHQDFKASFDHAAADFELSTERDPQNFMAFDMLGLSHEQNSEWDEAIHDYSRELALNPKLGTARLADVYCGRGQDDARKENLAAAAVDYEKSVELGAKTDDGCSCEPYDSLLVVYTQTGQYDKAWDFVHRAQKSNHFLDGELVNLLKKASGRSS